MKRIPVVSSSELVSVGFDADSRILEVEFRNGALYQYSNVPRTVYSGLLGASSRGSYFNEYVKNAGYAFTRVR